MAPVRRFAEASAFARCAGPFLTQHEALNCLPLRIVASLSTTGDPLPAETYLATCHDGGGESAAVVGVALRTPPHNLVLATPAGPEVLRALAADLAPMALPGVFGITAEARAFAEGWSAERGVAARTTMELRAYELTTVRAAGDAPGEFRGATEADVPLLTEWERAFHREANPHAPAPAGPLDLDGLHVWESGGEVVSVVRARPVTPRRAVINAVYTPPVRRGRGYATAVVAAASALMLRRGFLGCLLFTDLANSTSNRIYQKIGYDPIGDFQQFQFSPTT